MAEETVHGDHINAVLDMARSFDPDDRVSSVNILLLALAAEIVALNFPIDEAQQVLGKAIMYAAAHLHDEDDPDRSVNYDVATSAPDSSSPWAAESNSR